jgi:serine/threonine protein kinase
MKPGTKNEPEDFDQLFERREQDETDAQPAGGQDSATFDETCQFQEPESRKQQLDVAFALAVVESGKLTERQLARAVRGWTIHGDQALSEHLVAHRHIPEAACAELEGLAADKLRRISIPQSLDGASTSYVLGELDTGGRITRMLGLAMSDDQQTAGRVRSTHTQYKLLRKLGQGGMGTVWLARDETLGRLVAIKEVRTAASRSHTVVTRFRREAQVTGRLEHPSIVPVHQLGEHEEDGRSFYVMRFLGKRTLEDAIVEYHERLDAGDDNPMHLHRLLSAFVTVCQAIAFAHSRHVVHRDLKPENIALDDYGQVIVLDWGLAKLTGQGEVHEIFGDLELTDMEASDGTAAGQVLGTPMYMAPEQAAGRSDEIEETTDVYGLGAILFAILTGYAPHEKSHESLTSTSKVSELFQAIVSSEPPKARTLNPDAPPELEAVCVRAMATKRYARYASALELADDIQRWMAGESVSNYAESWRRRALRWTAKHRRLSQITAAAATIVIVSAVTLGLASNQSRLAARQARFEGLKADARELEVSLESVAQDLAKDVRFMAVLPPIQGIIDARSGEDGEGEDVWRERLQVIYRGLLQANPDYLCATFFAVKESSDEVVRVERRRAGDSIRVMPEGRLATGESNALLARIAALEPGEVSIDDTALEHGHDAGSTGLVLSAGVSIYDETQGDAFGAVVIESDLEVTLRELLQVNVGEGETAYVVRADGSVILHYSRENEFQRASVGKPIGELLPEAAEFFAAQDGALQFSDGQSLFAIKVPLDPERDSNTIGIVLTVEQ